MISLKFSFFCLLIFVPQPRVKLVVQDSIISDVCAINNCHFYWVGSYNHWCYSHIIFRMFKRRLANKAQEVTTAKSTEFHPQIRPTVKWIALLFRWLHCYWEVNAQVSSVQYVRLSTRVHDICFLGTSIPEMRGDFLTVRSYRQNQNSIAVAVRTK